MERNEKQEKEGRCRLLSPSSSALALQTAAVPSTLLRGSAAGRGGLPGLRSRLGDGAAPSDVALLCTARLQAAAPSLSSTSALGGALRGEERGLSVPGRGGLFVCFLPHHIFMIAKRKKPSGHPENCSSGSRQTRAPLIASSFALRRQRRAAGAGERPGL